ncbi:MAG: hypothetical protein ACNS63_11900 [Candidatus Nitrospinota bacterium M3_3B_026]
MRRKFLIHKPAQLKLVAALAASAAVVNVTSLTLLYNLLRREIENAMFSSHIKLRTLGELITPIVFRVNTWAVVAIMAVSAAIIAWVVFRMNRSLRLLRRDMGRIGALYLVEAGRFERGEAIRNMMEEFDSMVGSLNESFSEVASASGRLSEIAGREGRIDPAAVKEEVLRIRTALEKFD